MARFQIVGLNDCPWFAKAEKLADEIVALNPAIEFHKEMHDRFHWADFCERMKQQRGWNIIKSPVVFEVLVELQGKATLIGDINDFCEFAAMYFDIYYDPTSAALTALAMSNKTLFGRGFDGKDSGETAIFNVAIVNAPIRLLELLLTQLLSPVSMVPTGMYLNIQIFDEVTTPRALNGLLMEIFDLASPILYKASISNSLNVCFYRCNLFILAENYSRGGTEDSKDWITRVEHKVLPIIEAFNDRRTKTTDCRIIVGGEGPQCYIAEMMQMTIDPAKAGPGQIIASGQYIAQRAKCELSKVGNIPAGCIARVHAWGWPGETGAYIEVKDSVLRGAEISIQGPGVEIPLTEVATNSDFIFTKFSKEFLHLQKQQLNCAVPKALRDMVMAESILNTVHIWLSSEELVPFNKQKAHATGTGTGGSCSGIVNPNSPSLQSKKTSMPVINVGVACPNESAFPPGTYMVQPAICIDGRWKPLGKISDKTNAKVVVEVLKLWEERQKLIYRDRNISHLFPEYDQLIGQEREDDKNSEMLAKEAREPFDEGDTETHYADEEFLGEISDFYTIPTTATADKDEEEEE